MFILPPQKELEFSEGGWAGGRVSVRLKNVKKCLKFKCDFQRGGGENDVLF